MQPDLLVRPAAPLLRTEHGVVLAVRGTGPLALRDAVRRLTDEPDLLPVLRRVVVLDGAPTAMPLDARDLPVGALRVLRRPGAGRPEAIAALLAEALAEPGAAAVLLLDDVALRDPEVLRSACDAALASVASDVIGLRDPGAEGGPETWWGAVLPTDAVRAVGATLPEAGEVALAELVLRAASAGFRPTTLAAAGPVPAVGSADRELLALLHGPVSARGSLVRAVAVDLVDGVRGRGAARRTRLWFRWPALRRSLRSGAIARASHDAWLLRAACADAWIGRSSAPRAATAA